jgi:dolichol-phosphate mannosyltransferase
MPSENFELTIVMPVYNEQDAIEGVVQEWMEEMRRLGIRVEFRLYNDGSRDGTAERLESLKKIYPDLIAVNKPNEGHGTTILRGYREATAPWVFQTDSDGEMPASSFGELWRRRENYDALFGIRQGRVQATARKWISFVSRSIVTLLFGRGVADVNTPYRLIRRPILQAIVSEFPQKMQSPNVPISGALARAGVRIWNQPVPHQERQTGTVSIVRWSLWRAAFRSFKETMLCLPKLGRIARKIDEIRASGKADCTSGK